MRRNGRSSRSDSSRADDRTDETLLAAGLDINRRLGSATENHLRREQAAKRRIIYEAEAEIWTRRVLDQTARGIGVFTIIWNVSSSQRPFARA